MDLINGPEFRLSMILQGDINPEVIFRWFQAQCINILLMRIVPENHVPRESSRALGDLFSLRS
jgi:hypothetical protein